MFSFLHKYIYIYIYKADKVSSNIKDWCVVDVVVLFVWPHVNRVGLLVLMYSLVRRSSHRLPHSRERIKQSYESTRSFAAQNAQTDAVNAVTRYHSDSASLLIL